VEEFTMQQTAPLGTSEVHGSFEHPMHQLEDTSRRLRLFFITALIALLGWVVVQTLFSLSPFGRANPFVVLGIEFVWWLSLLAALAVLFRRVLGRLTVSTRVLRIAEQRLENANEQIAQKNALLERSIKDVWAARKRFTLPAKVVAPGHYQIQDLFGGYRDVRVQNDIGSHKLVCGCYVYQKEHICPHTIAAASLHLRIWSILRQKQYKHEVPKFHKVRLG